jgi:hypothetical protein|tara:strand:- start:61 stop:618 length:558 start_codon:yes stop_codon:yes gene_type:complete
MINVQDSFLSPEEFDIFNKSMISKGSKINNKSKNSWVFSHKDLKGDITLPTVDFGKHMGSVVSKIKDVIGGWYTNIPDIYSVTYAYSKQGFEVDPHIDSNSSIVTEEALSKTYKAFLFGHTVWEDWGGKLGFSSGEYAEYMPLPNRLIVFSLDERYWVTQVTTKADEATRMFMSVRFGNADISFN